MKIDSNTSVEEVKQKTKNTMVELCSVNKSKPKTISEGIRKQFDDIRQTNEEIDLDDSTITKLLEVQNIIYTSRNNNETDDEFILNFEKIKVLSKSILDNIVSGMNLTLK